MIVTIILHTIAAILWFISLVFAVGCGVDAQKNGTDQLKLPIIILIFCAVCAFILQVIA